jgi:ABC-type multidrug transport system ATPase subunit
MKLVQLEIDGVSLFENNKFEINFLNRYKMYSDNNSEFYNLFKSKYLPKSIAILGNNAAGKTTVLNLLNYTLETLFVEGDINKNDNIKFFLINMLDNKNGELNFKATFFQNNSLINFYSTVQNIDGTLSFKSEYIDKLVVNNSMLNSVIDDFISSDRKSTVKERDKFLENSNARIPDDSSIFKFIADYEEIFIANTLSTTNFNILYSFVEKIPSEWIQFVDDSILSISKVDVEGNTLLEVNFKNGKTHTANHADIMRYISSGTAKTLTLLSQVVYVLQSGGYFIVDELENHLNKRIVQQIIDLFNDETINVNNATIIFSTHYSELLDNFNRMDNVFIASRKDSSICVNNFRSLVVRTDVKKSDIYLSSLEGVGINYKYIKEFKKYFRKSDGN